MSDFFTSSNVQVVASMLVLCVLIAVGVWLVSIFRDRTDDDGEPRSEVLSNFREMAREGDISESEFRTIEAVMGDKPLDHAEAGDLSDSD